MRTPANAKSTAVELSCSDLPSELAAKISPSLCLALGAGGVFTKLFGIGLAVFGMNGPVVPQPGESPHHSLLMFFAGPWVFPAIVALVYTISPFRPYRGTRFVEKKQDVDTSDPVVMRLVELFRSREAKVKLWCQTVILSGILFLSMIVLAIMLRHTVSWPLSFADLGGAGLALGGVFICLAGDHIRWGLTTWAARETGR